MSLSACIHRSAQAAPADSVWFHHNFGTMIASHVGHTLLAGMGRGELQLAAGDTYRMLTP